MNLLDVSEIITGGVMAGFINPNHVPTSRLVSPYDRIMEILKDGGNVVDVIDTCGLEPVRAAQDAFNHVTSDVDWLKLLDKAYARDELARVLERQVKRLRNGQDEDASAIIAAIHNKQNYGSRYVTLDRIDPQEAVWVKTGFEPLDEHVGGLPGAGLTIVAAPPGVGKTSLMLAIVTGFAKQDKKSLVYTFEMTTRQVLYRLMQVQNVSSEDRSKIIACEDILNIDEVYADASRIVEHEQVEFICMDFADLMISGIEDEQSVAHVYRTSAALAKVTQKPVMLLSQLNREYVRGIPRIHNIRWSGLAEAMAALILLLYNPSQIWADMGMDNRLPIVPGRGYIIVGKSRFGIKEGGIGAMGVGWNGVAGWENIDYGWYPLGA